MSARSFPLFGDYINGGSGASLDDLVTATFVAWVYPTAFAANQVLWSKNGTTRYARFNTAARLNFAVARATTPLEVTATDTLTANRWAFVAGALNTGGVNTDQKAYYGSLTSVVAEVSAYTTQQVGTGAVTSDAAGNLSIGSNTASQPFTGRVAWVQVYNRQLSLGELRMLQGDRSLKLQGCVGFWQPGWDAGTTVPDLSGSGNHGTITGAPTYVAGLPLAYTTGSVARMPYTAVAAAATGGKRIDRRRRRLIIRGGRERRLR